MYPILAQMLTESYVKDLARQVEQDHQTIIALLIAVLILAIGVITGSVVVLVNQRRLTRLEMVGPSLQDRISTGARVGTPARSQ